MGGTVDRVEYCECECGHGTRYPHANGFNRHLNRGKFVQFLILHSFNADISLEDSFLTPMSLQYNNNNYKTSTMKTQ